MKLLVFSKTDAGAPLRPPPTPGKETMNAKQYLSSLSLTLILTALLPAATHAQGMGMGMGATGGKPPEGLAGIWQRSGGSLTPVILTEYGKKKSQGTVVFDDPNTRCEGYSIARSGLSSFGVTKIETGDDFITIRYEANAGTRKVYLDGKRRSEDENINGSSIGRLSRGVVEIESDNFGPEGTNALMANGVADAGSVYWLGEDFKMYERFSVVDENTLDYVMVMVDPVMIEWPRVIHAKWKRLPDDTPFIQSECELPEEDFYTPEDLEKLRKES